MEPIFESAATFSPTQFRAWVEEREVRGDINHYELLHGRIVMNPPAAWPHGRVGARVVAALINHVTRYRLGEVTDSSQGFALPSGDVVEPDVSFISNERLKSGQVLAGEFLGLVPDLVVEIASPSTVARDRGEKLGIYEQNGVREYWQIDPRMKRVRVLVARDGKFVEHSVVENDGKIVSSVLDGLVVSLEAIF